MDGLYSGPSFKPSGRASLGTSLPINSSILPNPNWSLSLIKVIAVPCLDARAVRAPAVLGGLGAAAAHLADGGVVVSGVRCCVHRSGAHLEC